MNKLSQGISGPATKLAALPITSSYMFAHNMEFLSVNADSMSILFSHSWTSDRLRLFCGDHGLPNSHDHHRCKSLGFLSCQQVHSPLAAYNWIVVNICTCAHRLPLSARYLRVSKQVNSDMFKMDRVLSNKFILKNPR